MLAPREARALGAALLVLVILLIPLQTIANYFTTSGLPEVLWIMAGLASVSVLTTTASNRR
jgi:hypothetical protein